MVLVKKLDDDLKDQVYKIPEGEIFKIQQNHNPTDLYTVQTKIYQIGDLAVYNAKDNTHGTTRLIKYATSLNDNEIKALRELREQDRLIQLIEGSSNSSSCWVYSYVLHFLRHFLLII